MADLDAARGLGHPCPMHDYLIIGGGIAGVSAAARLAPLGSTVLLEAEDHLAHHASGRSAALFEQDYGLAPVVALSRASRAELGERGVLSPRGLMIVGEGDAFEADLAALHLTEIAPDEAVRRCPILRPPARAGWSDDALDIDTDALVQGFAREARAAGAAIRPKAPVTALTRTATGWRAATPQGEVEARVVVNAAGAWADRIAAMVGIAPLGLVPHRRSMARIPVPVDPSGWPMVTGAGETWYAKPDAGALIVSPAEEDAMEPHDAWADDMVLAEGLARFEAATTIEVTRLLSSWAGLRTFAPDRVLALGPDRDEPSFLWCAGQGGYGFQTACAASRLLAAVATGATPPVDPAPYDPGRLQC